VSAAASAKSEATRVLFLRRTTSLLLWLAVLASVFLWFYLIVGQRQRE